MLRPRPEGIDPDVLARYIAEHLQRKQYVVRQIPDLPDVNLTVNYVTSVIAEAIDEFLDCC